jgi:hypothetical protein
MPGMTDEHDLTAAAMMDLGLAVHLGDERAGGIEREEIAALCLIRNRFRHAVSREDHRRVGLRNFVEFLDKDRSLRFEALHHVAVVHDLMPHIDRRAVALERLLHRIDGANHPGAESARRAQQDREWRLAGGI